MPGDVETRYTIRPCRDIGELGACVRLQKQIWGYADAEAYPLRLFVNLTHIGGQVIGAFSSSGRPSGRQAGKLVGFVAAMPAWRDGKRYLHSLSLAVARGYQNRGLGRKLKLEQRKLALEAGINSIEWTFDPLQARNAFFNIVRLGAITRRYQPDYYGRVRSRLQQGLPSDRLVCEWQLRSARVRAAVAPDRSAHLTAPKTTAPATIIIPADFSALARQDHERARKLQASVRRGFEAYFRQGLVVSGFERGANVARYLLG